MSLHKLWPWALGTLLLASAAPFACWPVDRQAEDARPTPVAEQPVHEPVDDATTEESDPSPVDEATRERIDRWIEVEQLNEFGDPLGTVYLGGTPLFDEAGGDLTDRYVFILERHPELGGCDPTDPVVEESPEEEPVNDERPGDDDPSSNETCE